MKIKIANALLISTFLTTAFAVSQVSAQNIPTLPSLDDGKLQQNTATTSSASTTDIPSLPTMPELPNIAAGDKSEKSKDVTVITAEKQAQPSSAQSGANAQIAPEVDFNSISKKTATAPTNAATTPNASTPSTTTPINNNGVEESAVKLTPQIPMLSIQQSNEKSLNSVLDSVFGEKKPDEPRPVKVEEATSTKSPKTSSTTSNASSNNADEGVIEATSEEEKVITTDEIQALEANTTTSTSAPSETHSVKKVNYAKKPEPFKSQTYSDAQLANQLVNESMKGNRDNVISLINSGISVNAANENLETALMAATFTGNEEIMALLLAEGANVNARDKNGNTALHIAASRNNAKAVQSLLSAKADINSKNIAGDSPLLIAVNNGQSTIVQSLISSGADVNIANNEGLTPLHMAAYSGNAALVQALLAKGANKSARTNQGVTPYDIAVLKSPQLASSLAPAVPATKAPVAPVTTGEIAPATPNDSSTQLAMFPKELVNDKPAEPVKESGWWAENASKNTATRTEAAAPAAVQTPVPEMQATLEPLAPAAGVSEIQNLPMSMRLSNAINASSNHAILNQPTAAKGETRTVDVEEAPLNQISTLEAAPAVKPVITNAPASSRIISTSVNSPEYNPELSQKIEKAINANARPDANLANAPTTPVQGLTKVSYESERVVSEIPVANNAQPASIRLRGNAAPAVTTPAATLAFSADNPETQPKKLPEIPSAPVIKSEVPFNLRKREVALPGTTAIETTTLPYYDGYDLNARNRASAQTVAVTQPASQPLSKPASQQIAAKPLAAAVPVVSAPAKTEEATEISDTNAPKNLASTFAPSPIRNLKATDYAGFYNGNASAEVKSAPVKTVAVPAAPVITSSAAASTSALNQGYANMSSEERAKWDQRMQQWLQAKDTGNSTPEMLNKQERILRAVYKDQFEAAVSLSRKQI